MVAHGLIRSDVVWILRSMLGNRMRIGHQARTGGWREVRWHSTRSLAGEVAGLGAMLEALDPPELRDHLVGVGAELADLYGARLYGAEPK